jgi:hypothetical protein
VSHHAHCRSSGSSRTPSRQPLYENLCRIENSASGTFSLDGFGLWFLYINSFSRLSNSTERHHAQIESNFTWIESASTNFGGHVFQDCINAVDCFDTEDLRTAQTRLFGSSSLPLPARFTADTSSKPFLYSLRSRVLGRMPSALAEVALPLRLWRWNVAGRPRAPATE